MNVDIARERQQSKLDPDALCMFLDGGAAKTARRRFIRRLVEEDSTGVFDLCREIYKGRPDRIVGALRRARRLEELRRSVKAASGSWSAEDEDSLLEAAVETVPTYLHRLMFVPNVELLCDAEQLSHWLPLGQDMKVLGCYAQTELGHGTNIVQLETTARYLAETDEFEVNSPTPTSAKWWPGGLGRTANTAMVMAQLYIGGKCYGLHNFLVPIRSLETHRPLPGVTVADIGPKIGFATMDNGYLRFDKVRIPRRNMAMRFARVDRGGRYSAGSSLLDRMVPRITMVQVRALIIRKAGQNLARACTIAVRYSAVRRQGGGSGNGDARGKERQVLDYTSQQHRLLPLLASAYAFRFCGAEMGSRLEAIEAAVLSAGRDAGDGGSASAANLKETEADLQQYHCDSSGLKSFCSGTAADGIEECRRACGGHGFLANSGLPELLGTYAQNVTVEGENAVIIQQTARFLVKVVAAAKQGRPLPKGWSQSCYLVPLATRSSAAAATAKCTAKSAGELRHPAVQEAALTHRAARLAVTLAARLWERRTDPEAAWNDALVEVARVGRAHSQLLCFKAMAAVVGAAEGSGGSGGVGKAALEALQRLLALLALSWVEKDMGDFTEDGYLNAQQASWVRSEVVALLHELRPDAVALVDAWDFSDRQLRSTLGRYDGRAMEALLEELQNNPLNAPDAIARCDREVLALTRREPVSRL